jgi:ubiquinone/menaquinone biosynthesis C-methylase UbiE
MVDNDYSSVFGEPFSRWSEEDVIDTSDNYTARFLANNIEPSSLFSEKSCLDAGTGGGRASLFMLKNGAEHVTFVDISEKNIETTSNMLKAAGYTNFSGKVVSLDELPYDDEKFDFVWCYGVIHHTKEPDASLVQISRVLRRGGNCFLFLYGSGGIYWYTMSYLRDLLSDITANECISILSELEASNIEVSNYVDDWKVPFMRRYTHHDVMERVRSLGFDEATPWMYGMEYDSSNRKTVLHDSSNTMGEGDLRYLLKKNNGGKESDHMLSDSMEGSVYPEDSVVSQTLDSVFLYLNSRLDESNAGNEKRVWLAREVSSILHSYMRKQIVFNLDEYCSELSGLL